jgi:hypothetical protein
MEECWTLPSWNAARPLNSHDEKFGELFVDLGPSMPRAGIERISDVYLDALLRTHVPAWLRSRLQAEQARRSVGRVAQLRRAIQARLMRRA